MKSIIVTLSFLYVVNLSFAQDLMDGRRNSFELESFYQFSKYTTFYGQGISHKYALSHSFALRQSLRYMRSDSDFNKLANAKTSQSHISYNLDLVTSFGKAKSWELTLGGGYEWKKVHSYQEYRIADDSYFGIQLGLNKTIKLRGVDRLKLGYMGSYYDGEMRNGLRLGVMF